MEGVRATGFDHLVLRVADLERSLEWYQDKLDLSPVRVEEWRRGEAPFPSLRVSSTTIIDLVPAGEVGGHVPRSGLGTLDHFCLVIEPCDFAAVASGFTVVDGPGARFGAQGTATSLYVSDPDGNTVELRYYERAAITPS